MTGPVKTGLRGAQSRATRRRIIDAAAALFIDNGYGATTLEQVADRAGVAVQTVYFHFGNKRTVLKEAVDVTTVGDDEAVALLERPWMQRVREEPDPHRLITLWAENSRAVMERSGRIMGVVRDAAVTDPDMAAQWSTNEQQRLSAFNTLAQLLADRDALKPGLSVAEAADVIFALLSPELYLVLTTRRSWTTQRWQQWMTEMLTTALLR
jgi:AcrR family transcriptional regulator